MQNYEAPCPQCQGLNSVSAKRCRSCGASLVEGSLEPGLLQRLFGRFRRRRAA